MTTVIPLHFATSNLPGDIAIRIAQYGFIATHVDVVLPGNKFLAALPSHGVNIYDAYPHVWEKFINLPCTDEQLAAFMRNQTNRIGQPYGLLPLFTNFVLEQDRTGPGYFCSDIIASDLEYIGWFKNPLAEPPERLTVRDLAIAISANGVPFSLS